MYEQMLLNQRISEVRYEYKRASRQVVWALSFAIAFGILVLLVLLDRIFALPVLARQVLLATAVAGVLAVFIVGCARRLWRRLPDARLALYVEERLGGFDDALVTAATLKPEELPSEEIPLAKALIARVSKKLQKRDITSAVDFSLSRKTVTVALMAFALTLATTVIFPRETKRVLFPVSRFVPGPVALQVDVTPKSIEVERGGSTEVVARVNRAVRRRVTLVYTPEADSERRIPMQQVSDDLYHVVLADIDFDGVYQVVLEKACSPEYPVKTFVPPAIESADHMYTFPDYLRLPPKIEEGADLTAVQGTKAKVTFRFNKPLSKCEVVVGEDERLPVELGEDEAQVELEIMKDGIYTVHLTDPDGRTNGEGAKFKIQAIPDHPPEITIVEPGGDVELDEGKEQPLRIEATDDFGVAEFSLVFNLNGGEEEVVDLDELHADIPPPSLIGNFIVNAESVDLQPGDVMMYYARAEDANTVTGPGKTRTKRFFIFGMLPYEDGPPCPPGKGSPPVTLTAIQRQIIIATATLADAEKEHTEQDGHFDDCRKVGMSEAELLRIVERLQSKIIDREEPAKLKACDDVIPLLSAARDCLEAYEPGNALYAEQKSLPYLYQLDLKIRRPQSKQSAKDSAPNNSEQVFHALLTKQVTDSKLPDEMKESKLPDNGKKTVTSPEHAPELIDAARRMEELARRQMNLGKAQDQANSDEEDQQKSLAEEQEELAEAAEELADELEEAARKDRGASALASAASQLREAAKQMKSCAAGAKSGKSGSARASARAAEQSMMKALERLSTTSEQSMAEQLRDAAREAHALAERREQLNEGSAAGSRGRNGRGRDGNANKNRNEDASGDSVADELADRNALLEDIREWRDDLERLHDVADELSESGAVRPKTAEQIEDALSQVPEFSPASEDALNRAAELLDAAAALEVSPEARLAEAARDAAELVSQLDQLEGGDLSRGSGERISSGGGLGGPNAWRNLNWACLSKPGVRDTALALKEKLAHAEDLQDAERVEFLKAEVLPIARKLEEQLSAGASGKLEDLLLTQGFDDNYPPEYRPVVEDYFKKLAQHPKLASDRNPDTETLP